jgi:transcriptional regulator with XRE-family HTH domain
MSKNFKKFGKILKELRIQKGLTLRRASRLANYDPSNWSKIERGDISPPSDEKVLRKWAGILGISKDTEKVQEFVDKAKVARGIIPQDILSQKNAAKYLPAFFRTARNKKPTKKEINQLIELIRGQ